MIKIIDNCCSPHYLDFLKNVAITSETWNLHFPSGQGIAAVPVIEDKFLKLNIIENGIKHPFLAGLAIGLLFQIYEAGGRDFFLPDPILFSGISIKDRHRIDNIHADEEPGSGIVKVLGILNTDWEEEWGGGFIYDGTSSYTKPTSFWIFDPSKKHAGAEIFTDKKRLAIDFSVFRNQQSLDKYMYKKDGQIESERAW